MGTRSLKATPASLGAFSIGMGLVPGPADIPIPLLLLFGKGLTQSRLLAPNQPRGEPRPDPAALPRGHVRVLGTPPHQWGTWHGAGGGLGTPLILSGLSDAPRTPPARGAAVLIREMEPVGSSGLHPGAPRDLGGGFGDPCGKGGGQEQGPGPLFLGPCGAEPCVSAPAALPGAHEGRCPRRLAASQLGVIKH